MRKFALLRGTSVSASGGVNFEFVLNLGHLDFEFVSTVRCPVEDFDIRISNFSLVYTYVRNSDRSKASNYAKQTQFAECSNERN